MWFKASLVLLTVLIVAGCSSDDSETTEPSVVTVTVLVPVPGETPLQVPDLPPDLTDELAESEAAIEEAQELQDDYERLVDNLNRYLRQCQQALDIQASNLTEDRLDPTPYSCTQAEQTVDELDRLRRQF